jgi:Zn-finger protein
MKNYKSKASYRCLFMAILGLAAFGATSSWAESGSMKSPQYCGSCHTRIYQEWKSSAMGKDLANPHVYQFYTGTNGKGEKDGLGFQPFTHGATGDCADCHVPQLTLDRHRQGQEVDLGVAIKDHLDDGISCNFCHTMKHADIEQGPDGRYRTRLFDTVTQDLTGAKYGPFTDAHSPAHPAAFSPLHRDSRLCAVCHLNQEKFLSISTYADWKEAYDSGKTQDTCQSCHMPLHKDKVNLAVGGPLREGVRMHNFIGASDPGLLQKALDLKLQARVEGRTLVVTATVENIGAGHKVPGSGPIRNIVLKVDAIGPGGANLKYVGEPAGLLPSLAGTGNPRTGARDALDWAGLPGRMYAKVYQSATMPDGRKMIGVGGFAADSILFDTALKPFVPDTAEFRFALPDGVSGKANVKASLSYRWAFKTLADSKGWSLDYRPMRETEQAVMF